MNCVFMLFSKETCSFEYNSVNMSTSRIPSGVSIRTRVQDLSMSMNNSFPKCPPPPQVQVWVRIHESECKVLVTMIEYEYGTLYKSADKKSLWRIELWTLLSFHSQSQSGWKWSLKYWSACLPGPLTSFEPWSNIPSKSFVQISQRALCSSSWM